MQPHATPTCRTRAEFNAGRRHSLCSPRVVAASPARSDRGTRLAQCREHSEDNWRSMKQIQREGPAWGKLAAIVLGIFLLAMVWRYSPLADAITPERIIDWARWVGDVWWAPFAVIA